MATFQERLRELRDKKGWSQPELADEFTKYMQTNRDPGDRRKHRYSAQHISKWETKSLPRSDTFAKLADFFNVSSPYLAGVVDDPKAILSKRELDEAEEALVDALRKNPQEALVVYKLFGITPPPYLYVLGSRNHTALLEEGDEESDTPSIDEAANS